MTSATQKPLLVVADDDGAERARMEEELERRYGADYAGRGCTTAEMKAVLERAQGEGNGRCRRARRRRDRRRTALRRSSAPSCRPAWPLDPVARLDGRSLREVVLRAMARGWIDLYVLRPTRRADEIFHRTIAELLQESARQQGVGPSGATVVADPRSSRAHELGAILAGLGIPYRVREPGAAETPAPSPSRMDSCSATRRRPS